MTDLLTLEELPTPAPVQRRRRRGNRLGMSVASGLAGAVGFAGFAVLSDLRADDSEQATATSTALAVPMLAPTSESAELSGVGSTYAVAEWSTSTSSGVLGAWGAVTTGVVGDGQPAVAALTGQGVLLDDPRLGDPATPGFADPCAVRSSRSEPEGCPDTAVLGSVLGDRAPAPNTAAVYAFPPVDLPTAAACSFDDLDDGQVPVAVITSNPGTVTLTLGEGEEISVESSDAERDEWDDWMDRPVGVRTPVSFVAHCLVLDAPAGPGPLRLRAIARDDEGQEATADTTLSSLGDGLPPVAITAVDPTMVRVDVPLPAGADPSVVLAVPLSWLGGEADCGAVTIEHVAAAASGWRRGATAIEEAPSGARAGHPWLDAAPRVQRVTVPLSEGEPNLLCVRDADAPTWHTRLLVEPPDSRRLVLAVSELSLLGTPTSRSVEVSARFAQLGWTPCGVQLGATLAARTEPGPEGVLCTSGGDAGPLVGAGGVAEISVGVGEGAAFTARIALTPTPDGPDVQSYRLPIPDAELDGVLCTAGADQPSCVPPDADTTIGTVVITARWSDGPVGAGGWLIRAPSF